MSASDEVPIEYEQAFIDGLNEAFASYLGEWFSAQHIVSTVTSFLFCNEYYFRRDAHIVDPSDGTLTIFLYKSKFRKHLFKLKCRIDGAEFIRTLQPMADARTDQDARLLAWIDTECKNDSFASSRAANMCDGSFFLMMTYVQASNEDNHALAVRQHLIPWLVQWRYDAQCKPFMRVISRVVSYPSNWNYVTLSYPHRPRPHDHPHRVCVIFYTSTEQHCIEYVRGAASQYQGQVRVTAFAHGLNYPWLMFGSAATNILTSDDVALLLGDSSALLRPHYKLNRECEYFITRSCLHFAEYQDDGTFWTSPRDSISIFEISDIARRHPSNASPVECPVAVNLAAQFRVLDALPSSAGIALDADRCQRNILDVTVTKDWSRASQRTLGVKGNTKALMVLYTEIRHEEPRTDLFAAYVRIENGALRLLKHSRLASSEIVTKFLVGRGSYQTVRNDWLCTLIGIDHLDQEVRHQLRLAETLELLYYQQLKGNESVQERTNPDACKALLHFERAHEEEREMQLQQQQGQQFPNIMHSVLTQMMASRHLIFSTLLGAYIGYRVSKAIRSGQWSFSNIRLRF